VHYAILVEDTSGKQTLDILVPKIIGDAHTFVVHAYKGIGRIPKNMRDANDASKRILLDNLPKLLKGYGKTFRGYGHDYPCVVILVCDLDDKCMKTFKTELLGILDACNPRPAARFCFAIEEGEAWLLGDLRAVRLAYPKAKSDLLNSYINDSICGTWEKLADAIFPGGSQALSSLGWYAIGAEKSKWATNIAHRMNINGNHSPSFQYFRDKLFELGGI
jgi:hypothetical protein